MGLLQGCSDGFWRNHPEDWPPTGFSTTDLFDSIFVRAAFPGLTLLQVLEQMGGGLNALGRQTVGALLNAAHPDVNYPISVAQVISRFQNAFDTGGAAIESQKDEFEAFNAGLPCPLD